MVCRRRRVLASCMVLATMLPVLSACSSSAPANPPSSGSSTAPITVEINQSRDQYGKQAIQIQFTNTTDDVLTVTGARVRSPLFDGDILWQRSGNGLELPSRQPKSVPAALPAASCGAAQNGSSQATLEFTAPGKEASEEVTDAADPFGVLSRNSAELCIAAQAAAVATLELDPELKVAADGQTAVVRLVITPAGPGAQAQSLTIESIDETTLLAQSPTDPWPRNVTVGSTKQELALTIRPARCDPHAVAEDKVGTLLPLRVRVGERQGLIKVAASTDLRGRIYDFVTDACAHG
ncbi:hypothetical protein [Paenarthrobacter sp. AB444]|uniref:hypothetical protein n=1 Tax=Paenarthrobacter sp. AB444 TaxID=3025681 RepID=UPI0023665A96|nr:hypothetical protein [Paenarthrobacter sp. AB444]MDD7834286.1 hypothetical protein [Paenarthrobacter sp. AB444]